MVQRALVVRRGGKVIHWPDLGKSTEERPFGMRWLMGWVRLSRAGGLRRRMAQKGFPGPRLMGLMKAHAWLMEPTP
eukprot:3476521-Pyramimonas_sp.AAC.1